MTASPGSNPIGRSRGTVHGFEQLARKVGVPVPPREEEPPAVPPEDAADTGRFPTLRAHAFGDTPAGRLRDRARAVADESQAGYTAATPQRGRGRGRRGGRGAGSAAPPPELDAVPAMLDELGLTPVAVADGPPRFVLEAEEAVLRGLPPVPAGYGFKGGVARKVLARTLRLDAFGSAVRDIDLLRDADTPGDDDHRLASLYMPDDLTLGEFGIEVLTDEGGYMGSRELTVNQLVLLGGRLTVTHACLLDTLGLTLRVTGAHLTRTRGYVHPGVALKALRFAANLTAEGGEPRVLPFRVTPRRMKHGFDFYFALHLSRVFETGGAAAEVYTRLADDRGFLKRARLPVGASAEAAAGILKKRLAAYHLAFPEGV
ncbi:hypothetical protein [Phycisphaera mikurensis]|uniref:Uncharacterized protein n=1 Tax=Phycisphaera mikurensis (strain NBRC 102666 / KCTC 22515 / FYK2301M01) TaxID=1142394 RepID=I0IH84_PHYMF|nr:hypothetical protein [Phycisphaera mikurensis]MBB6440872.1 hypothetical protein [Phycisphaera mikurensis]BAM04622.1 hypothetical protein PSMK_24630 [Phycisphaera mikurensis NBRC 102666]